MIKKAAIWAALPEEVDIARTVAIASTVTAQHNDKNQAREAESAT